MCNRASTGYGSAPIYRMHAALTIGILPPLVPAASAGATSLLVFMLFALATALQALQVVI